jgi:hypothetical protein
LFNTVVDVALICPSCHRQAAFRIQFKYGATWQFDYHVGDALRWGVAKPPRTDSLDVGKPGYTRVVVDGVAEDCPLCGADGPECCDVFIERDRIVEVLERTQHDGPHAPYDDWVVLLV